MDNDVKKRSYEFAVQVVRFVDSIEHKGIRWSIYDQLLRSGTSIGANIHEARAASSRKDFINYFQIALKSCNETQYWLSLMHDAFGLEREKLHTLEIESSAIGRMLAASILTMKQQTKS